MRKYLLLLLLLICATSVYAEIGMPPAKIQLKQELTNIAISTTTNAEDITALELSTGAQAAAIAALELSTGINAANISAEEAARILADQGIGLSTGVIAGDIASETAARIAVDAEIALSTTSIASDLNTETSNRIAADQDIALSTAANAALAGNALPKSGGSMSGNLNMGSNNIYGVNKGTVTELFASSVILPILGEATFGSSGRKIYADDDENANLIIQNTEANSQIVMAADLLIVSAPVNLQNNNLYLVNKATVTDLWTSSLFVRNAGLSVLTGDLQVDSIENFTSGGVNFPDGIVTGSDEKIIVGDVNNYIDGDSNHFNIRNLDGDMLISASDFVTLQNFDVYANGDISYIGNLSFASGKKINLSGGDLYEVNKATVSTVYPTEIVFTDGTSMTSTSTFGGTGSAYISDASPGVVITTNVKVSGNYVCADGTVFNSTTAWAATPSGFAYITETPPGIDLSSNVVVTGYVKIVDGNQGNNKVWTSDANGLGSWQIFASSAGDNLGNHTATEQLQMNGYDISTSSGITGLKKIVWADGTVQYSSPTAGGVAAVNPNIVFTAWNNIYVSTNSTTEGFTRGIAKTAFTVESLIIKVTDPTSKGFVLTISTRALDSSTWTSAYSTSTVAGTAYINDTNISLYLGENVEVKTDISGAGGGTFESDPPEIGLIYLKDD